MMQQGKNVVFFLVMTGCFWGYKNANCDSVTATQPAFDEKSKIRLDRFYESELMSYTPDELDALLRDRAQSTCEPAWFIKLGEFYNRQGLHGKALDVYTKTIGVIPSSAEMEFYRVRQNIIVSETPVPDIFNQIQKLPQVQQILLLELLAEKSICAEDYNVAEQAAKLWAKLDTANPSPLVLQARIMVYRDDESAKAIKFLSDACEKNADNLKFWRCYAVFCECCGENSKAWDAWQQLLNRSSSIEVKLNVIRNLTLLSGRLKNTDTLIKQIEQQLSVKPENAFALLALAEINGIVGKIQLQKKYLDEAVASYPQNALVLISQAVFEKSQGNYLHVIEILDKAWNISCDYKLGIKLAWQYFDIGQFDKAWQTFERVFADKALPVEQAVNIVATLIIAGESKEAVKLADLCSQKHPDDYVIGYVKAIALEKSNQPVVAAKTFIDLLNIKADPTYLQDKSPAGLETYLYLSAQYPPCLQNIILLNSYISSAYSYREKDGIYTYTPIAETLNGIISLPSSRLQLQVYVLAHLHGLLSESNKLNTDDIVKKLQAAGIKDAEIMLDLAVETANQDFFVPDRTLGNLLKKYPDNQALKLMSILGSQKGHEASLEQIEDVYKEYQKTYPLFVLQILSNECWTQSDAGESVGIQPDRSKRINKIINLVFSLSESNSAAPEMRKFFSDAIMSLINVHAKSLDSDNRKKAETFLKDFVAETQKLENTPEKESQLCELISTLISMGQYAQANSLIAQYADVSFESKRPVRAKKTEEIYHPDWGVRFPPEGYEWNLNIPLVVAGENMLQDKATCVKMFETAQNRLLKLLLAAKLGDDKAAEKTAEEILNNPSSNVAELVYAATFFDKIHRDDDATRLFDLAISKAQSESLKIQLKVMLLQICMGNLDNNQFSKRAHDIIVELTKVRLDISNMEKLIGCTRKLDMLETERELWNKINTAKQDELPEYPWATYVPSYTMKQIGKDLYLDSKEILGKAVEFYLVITQPGENRDYHELRELMSFIENYNLQDKFLNAIKPSDTCRDIGELRRFAIACIQLKRFELAKQYCDKILKINNKDTFAVSTLSSLDVLDKPVEVSGVTATLPQRQKLALLSDALSKDIPQGNSLTKQVSWYKLVTDLLKEINPPLPDELRNRIQMMILYPSSVPLHEMPYVASSSADFTPGEKLSQDPEDASMARTYLDAYKNLLPVAMKFPSLQAAAFKGRILIRDTDKISDDELFKQGLQVLRTTCQSRLQNQSIAYYGNVELENEILIFVLKYASEHNKNQEIAKLIADLETTKTSSFYNELKLAYTLFNCSDDEFLRSMKKSFAASTEQGSSMLPVIWAARKSRPSLAELVGSAIDEENPAAIANLSPWIAEFGKTASPEDVAKILDTLWKKTGNAVAEVAKRKQPDTFNDKFTTQAAVFDEVFRSLCFNTPLSEDEIKADSVAEGTKKTAIDRQFEIDRILTDFLHTNPAARTQLDDSEMSELYARYYRLAHQLPQKLLALPVVGNIKNFDCYELSNDLNTLQLAKAYL